MGAEVEEKVLTRSMREEGWNTGCVILFDLWIGLKTKMGLGVCNWIRPWSYKVDQVWWLFGLYWVCLFNLAKTTRT